MRAVLLFSAALAAALNLAAESGVSIEKADPRMAVPSAAVKESGGIQWIDGRKLPGRAGSRRSGARWAWCFRITA